MVAIVVFCNHATMFHMRLSRVMMLVMVHFATFLKQEKFNQVLSSFIQFGPFATVLKRKKRENFQLRDESANCSKVSRLSTTRFR